MDQLDGKSLNGLKHWRDAKGHVLGVIEHVRVKVQVDGVNARYHTPRLLLFREAVDVEAEVPAQIDVAGTVEGRTLFSLAWRCSVPGCGCIKEWFPEPGMVAHFVRTYLAE
jgi:hypothetical protein